MIYYISQNEFQPPAVAHSECFYLTLETNNDSDSDTKSHNDINGQRMRAGSGLKTHYSKRNIATAALPYAVILALLSMGKVVSLPFCDTLIYLHHSYSDIFTDKSFKQ